MLLCQLQELGESILELVAPALLKQDLVDAAVFSGALRSSEGDSDLAEQNRWSAMLQLCFHFIVAPHLGQRCETVRNAHVRVRCAGRST